MDELLKEIEDDKKALAEIDQDSLIDDDEEDEIIDDGEVDDTEEPEFKEVEKEVVKEEVKEDPEPKDFAKMRRDANAAKKEAEDLRNEVARLKAERESPAEKEVEVPTIELPAEITSIVERDRYERAGREFARLEESFKRTAPEDFEDVSTQYKNALMQSIRIQNPRMGHEELLEATTKQLLHKASQYMNSKHDPIEEMYYEAKELGFKAVPKEAEVKETEKKTPDQAKLAANRERNAGTTATSGQGGAVKVTREAASNYTPAEWMKLPKEEKARLLRAG